MISLIFSEWLRLLGQLACEEQADLAVVIPAAYLHDCVSLPKDHAQRHLASTLAGDKAVAFLSSIAYPESITTPFIMRFVLTVLVP